MVTQALAVMLGTAATAVLFNVPRRALPLAPLAGLAGFLTAELLTGELWRPGSLFLAGLAVGLAAELLARLLRVPALVFSVPGILPLVPGTVAYRGMAAAVSGNYAQSAEYLSLAVLSAGALAMGLLLSSALRRLLFRYPAAVADGPIPMGPEEDEVVGPTRVEVIRP